MPSYKLHYFDVRGQGELIRFTLHAAGVPFEDYRVKRAEWPAIKECKCILLYNITLKKM